jgi:tetratricopeptide (TPR) repeat protein
LKMRKGIIMLLVLFTLMLVPCLAFASENEPTAKDWLAQGNSLLQDKNVDGAIEAYCKAIAMDNNLYPAYSSRGKAYTVKAQYNLAISDFKTVIQLKPDYADGYYNLAYVYRLSGQHEKVREIAKKGAVVDTQQVPFLFARAHAWNERGEYDISLVILDRAIALNPKNSILYWERGFTYWKKGNYQLSKADMSKAIELNPKNPLNYTGRGNAHGCLGQYAEAIKDFEISLKLQPTQYDGSIYFNLAQAHELLGNKDEALMYYEKATSLKLESDQVMAKIKARQNGDWGSFKEWL